VEIQLEGYGLAGKKKIEKAGGKGTIKQQSLCVFT